MKNQVLIKPLTTKEQKLLRQQLLNVRFSSLLITVLLISIFVYIAYNEPLAIQVISSIIALVFLGVLLPLFTLGIANIKQDLRKGKKNVVFGTIDKKFTQHSYTEMHRTSRGKTQYFIAIGEEGFRITEKQYLHCAKKDFVALEYAPISRFVISINVTGRGNIEDYKSKEISPQQFTNSVETESIASRFFNIEELKYLKHKRSSILSKGLLVAILLGTVLFFAFNYALSTFSYTKELFETNNKGEVLLGCFIFLFVVRKAFRPYIPLSRDIKLKMKNIIRTQNVQKISSDTKILQHNWQKIKNSNKYYYLKIGRAYVEITQKQYESVSKETFFEIHLTPNYRALLLVEWGDYQIGPIKGNKNFADRVL